MRDLTPMPQMYKSSIPAYYLDSAAMKNTDGIIEYPMFIGDPFNLYYYYQHFHKKQVVVGYLPDLSFFQLPSKDDFIYQDTPIDYVVARAVRTHGSRIRFSTMVPINDRQLLLSRYKNWTIIVHRDVVQELLGVESQKYGIYQLSARVVNEMVKCMGSPFYSDRDVFVWRVP
jgi:hypothetical protein